MTNPNLEMLRMAVENLDYLVDELVFVGGCTTGLFITDQGAGEVRVTDDVDTIVEAASYTEYVKFSEKLQNVGFQIDTSDDAPLCRWVKGYTILDVMPLDENTLGFTNIWYKSAMLYAQSQEILPGMNIRIITPPYFLATKLEAFNGRGKGDYLTSHDLEDVISVVDGRVELFDEILHAPEDVRLYISAKIDVMLNNRPFRDALPGFLHPDEASQKRVNIVLDRLKQLAKIGESDMN